MTTSNKKRYSGWSIAGAVIGGAVGTVGTVLSAGAIANHIKKYALSK